MSGGFSDAGKADFQARIARIQSKSAIEPAPIEVSQPLPTEAPRKREVRQDVNLNGSFKENIKFPLAIVGAFLVAILAVFMARYARFHLFPGDPSGVSDISLVIDAALAAGVGFIFRSAMRFETKEFMSANVAGILFAVCTLHNLVHWYPDVYDDLFSPEYTDAVLLMTDSNSILFRGYSIPIGDDPEYTYGGRFEGTEWEEFFQYEEAPIAGSSGELPQVFSLN